MLAVVGALGHEINGLRRQAEIISVKGVADRGDAFLGELRGRRFLLVRTGVGRRRATSAILAAMDSYPVTAVLSVGYAGSLRRGLGLGSLVICSSMLCADISFSESYDADASLLARAFRTARDPSAGVGVTSPTIVSSPAEKRALHLSTGADIVDMESYWIAAVASEAGIRCLVVRAISDSVNDSVPQFNWFSPSRNVPYFLQHPGDVLRLLVGIRRSNANLTAFVAGMIDEVA